MAQRHQLKFTDLELHMHILTAHAVKAGVLLRFAGIEARHLSVHHLLQAIASKWNPLRKQSTWHKQTTSTNQSVAATEHQLQPDASYPDALDPYGRVQKCGLRGPDQLYRMNRIAQIVQGQIDASIWPCTIWALLVEHSPST
jgi:hypothetical protein